MLIYTCALASLNKNEDPLLSSKIKGGERHGVNPPEWRKARRDRTRPQEGNVATAALSKKTVTPALSNHK